MYLSMLSLSGDQATYKNLIARLFREKGFCLHIMSPGWLHSELFKVYNWPLLAWGWRILILLTKYVVPGVFCFFFFFPKNIKIPTPMPDPPHHRLHIDVWIRILRWWGILQVVPSLIRISMIFYFIFCNFEVGGSSLFIFSIKSTHLNLHKT